MALDKDKQGALGAAGYERSSSEPNKWINKFNGHSVTDLGGSYIVNSDRHNKYGQDEQSTRDFKKRL